MKRQIVIAILLVGTGYTFGMRYRPAANDPIYNPTASSKTNKPSQTCTKCTKTCKPKQTRPTGSAAPKSYDTSRFYIGKDGFLYPKNVPPTEEGIIGAE
jgi:hypothetical protein